MRVGSLVYSTNQGLGILGKSFYDEGILTDVLVVKHSHRDNQYEWYPNANYVSGRETGRDLTVARDFCLKHDAMLFFETPFYWSLLPFCRKAGIKTFLMPMYECMPKTLPEQPDYFICPSLLDLRYFPDRSTFIPVPVPKWLGWKKREVAKVFVHNAGHGGLLNRNGTGELLDAMKYVQSPIKLILRSQKRLQWDVQDPRIDYRIGTFPSEELYKEGDVFVFPEKFNGLSLPLQEACASGMMVMCTNRFPNNQWLPTCPMIEPEASKKNRISGRCVEFDEAVISPKEIARTIDYWYGKDISEFSLSGGKYLIQNSWNVLRKRYEEVLKNGC